MLARVRQGIVCLMWTVSCERTADSVYTCLDQSELLADFAVVELGRFALQGLDRYQAADKIEATIKGLQGRHLAAGTQWIVGIEDYMRRFAGPRRNLFILAETNIITSLACFRCFGVKPLAVHPSTARADVCPCELGKVRSQMDSVAVKDRVLEFVSKRLPVNYEWPRSSNGKSIHASAYDVADAYIIATYTILADWRQQWLAAHADVVTAAVASYEQTKRYATALAQARQRGGPKAVRTYQDSVRSRIERRLMQSDEAEFLKRLLHSQSSHTVGNSTCG